MLTLAELEKRAVDMFTTVFIGNAAHPGAAAAGWSRRGGTAYEGSRVQRHHRGPRAFPDSWRQLGADVLVSVATPLGSEEQGSFAGITVHVRPA